MHGLTPTNADASRHVYLADSLLYRGRLLVSSMNKFSP